MTHEQLLAYYGESMRLCMIYRKLADLDMTKEGHEVERNMLLFDEQMDATGYVSEAYDYGLLENVEIHATNAGHCKEVEKIAWERLENFVSIKGRGEAVSKVKFEPLEKQQ